MRASGQSRRAQRLPRHAGAGGPARRARPSSGRHAAPAIVAAVLAAITLAAYAGALGHSFVDWDDLQYVSENPLVLHQDFGRLLVATVSGNYHPLTMLSLALNVTRPLSPRPFIATNVALHVLNTLLAFWLVFLISRRRLLVAALVALLFGIHPMHVESVAWIAERKDVLYTAFFLGGLIAYWRHLERRAPTTLALAFALFLLSCLAKGMAVVFPLIMVLLDFWKGRPLLERRAILEKSPFLAVGVLFGLIAINVQAGGDFGGLLPPVIAGKVALAAPAGFTPLQRLLLPTYGFMAYVWKLFAPVNLCAFYPYPAAGDTGKAVYLMAPFFFAALAALALWDARRTRVIAFGVGWYAATVALVLQWIPVGGAIMADRYAYLSYLGLFFVLAMAVDGLLGRSRTLGIGLLAVCGLFAVMLFAGTLAQVEVWRDTETLWNQAIRLYPGVGASHVYRGKQRSLSGRIPEALDDFRTARDLGYRTADVYEGLGAAYGSLGKLDSALVMLDQAVRLEPRRGGLYYNRAVTNLALGRPREALSDLDRALALVPDRAAEFWAPRGYARMQLGEYAEAIPEFDRAIAAGAAGAAIRYSRGFCRLRLGDRAGAAADFRETLRLDPGHAEARVQLRALGI